MIHHVCCLILPEDMVIQLSMILGHFMDISSILAKKVEGICQYFLLRFSFSGLDQILEIFLMVSLWSPNQV